MKKIKNYLKSNHGGSLIEFAIISPLLFILIFGIIEFSAVLYNQAVITNASREASRYAATFYTNPSNATAERPSCNDIQTYVVDHVNARFINFTNSTPFEISNVICPNTNPYTLVSGYAGYVDTIKIEYQYDFLVFNRLIKLVAGQSGAGGLMLTAQTTMRDENQD